MLRNDYGELTKIIHQCEDELKQGLSDGERSRQVSGADTEAETRELKQWLTAQKGALSRIDALQEQIGKYREKLLASQGDHSKENLSTDFETSKNETNGTN